MTDMTFDLLADELEGKVKKVGNLGVTVKFVFEGMGSVFIDCTKDEPTLARNIETAADFVVSAPLKVWLDLRNKKLAPHVAAMTRKVKFTGDLVRGLKLVPRFMGVL